MQTTSWKSTLLDIVVLQLLVAAVLAERLLGEEEV